MIVTGTGVNAVRSEMVDEILENIHHVGADVVERDGTVTAAAQTLFLWVVDVVPVPHVFR